MIRRSERKREAEAQAVVLQFHPGNHFERHAYGFARPNVAHREIHHAIGIVAGQGGEMAAFDPRFISLYRFGYRLQFGVDREAFAGDAEAAQGGIAGQREGIDHFERTLFVRREYVAHHQPRARRQYPAG